MEKLKSGQALTDVLDFTLDDLQANRSGDLSERQIHILHNQMIWQTRGMYASFFVFPPLSWILTTGLVNVSNSPAARWVALLVIVIGFGGMGVFCWSQRNATRRELESDAPAIVEGRIRLSLNPTFFGELSYQLRIADQSFKTDKNTFLAFKNEDPYIIYFAPHSRRILSAEWLR